MRCCARGAAARGLGLDGARQPPSAASRAHHRFASSPCLPSPCPPSPLLQGQNFAYLQIKTIWSVLLRNFDLELVRGWRRWCLAGWGAGWLAGRRLVGWCLPACLPPWRRRRLTAAPRAPSHPPQVGEVPEPDYTSMVIMPQPGRVRYTRKKLAAE